MKKTVLEAKKQEFAARTQEYDTKEAILLAEELKHDACLVKHANKIDERLVGTFRSAINYLGVSKWWKLRKSPFEYVLLNKKGKETNVSIKFTGADDAESLKSYRPRLGSFRYVWFEEVTGFSGIKEINNIVQCIRNYYRSF